MSQYSVPPASTGSFGNRLTSWSSTPSADTWAAITRPLDAPRSTPATATALIRAGPRASSSEERRGDPRVDGDEQSGGEREVPAGECEDGCGDVLGQHLALEQGPLGV